jgi:hypothetical protein
MLDLIKREKSNIEKTRTISKIHVSWHVARKFALEFAEKHGNDYDPVSSNGENTLLGCELVVHVGQAEVFWFEDVNGRKIIANLHHL